MRKIVAILSFLFGLVSIPASANFLILRNPNGSSGPTLNALSLSTPAFTTGAGAGSVISAIASKTTGSTLTLTNSDGGAVALSGTNLTVGATPPASGGTFSITVQETLAGAVNSPKSTTFQIAMGDAFFIANGTDTGGTTIGTNCTSAAPCQTVNKALAFLKANIAGSPGASHNYALYFQSSGGPFFLAQTELYTTAHTVNSSYTTSFLAYPGQTPVWSSGTDTAGTWSSTTIPNGTSTAGCVSTALVSYAPLTTNNVISGHPHGAAELYAGAIWVNGNRRQENVYPAIGNMWETLPGGNSQTFPGPTYTSSGGTSLTISDLSQIGNVGDPISFYNGPYPHPQIVLWILTKSAPTGSGTITVASAPGGSASTFTSGSGQVADNAWTPNGGGGGRQGYSNNVFTVNESNITAYNPQDVYLEVKALSSDSGSGVIPAYSISGTTFTGKAHPLGSSGAQVYRWRNVFEKMTAGTIWVNRTTGNLYYIPMPGETCASINAAGVTYVPRLNQLLRISNSVADTTIAGGSTGVNVGNLVISGIAFEHNNNELWEQIYGLGGWSGGTAGGDAPLGAWGTPAIDILGATTVTLNGITVTHLGGSGVRLSNGSFANTVENSTISEAGGYLLLTGMGTSSFADYEDACSSGYSGTTSFGASTSQWCNSLSGDQTGAHDASNVINNNYIGDNGRVFLGTQCLGVVGWQSDTIKNNTIGNCTSGGFWETGDPMQPTQANEFVALAPQFGNSFIGNLISNVGYEQSVAGVPVAGSSLLSDLAAFYIKQPQDGPGDGSKSGLVMQYNVVKNWAGTQSIVGDYHDGNSTCGVTEQYNLFANLNTTSVTPATLYEITQHTGNCRSTISNNIFAAVVRSNWTFNPAIDAPLFNNLYKPGATYGAGYVAVNSNNLYTTSAGGTAASGSCTATGCTVGPTCTSGTCSDNTITWTWDQAIGNQYQTLQSNIYLTQVVGSNSAISWQGANGQYIWNYPQYTRANYNLYSQLGTSTYVTLTNYGPTESFMAWQGLGEDANSLFTGQGPNFVNWTGGTFAFNATQIDPGSGVSCGGTGGVSPACGFAVPFVPWDTTRAGVGAGY